MHIRSASLHDTAALGQLWQACELTRPWNDPENDIRLALGGRESTILVGERDTRIMASAMCGFDGHRGWIYYVAVAPPYQKQGFARQITLAAEDWLKTRGCPKVELIIRNSNIQIQDIYEKMGYQRQPCALMAKWLRDPPMADTEKLSVIRVAVTYLEMTEPPSRIAAPMPNIGKPISLTHVQEMSIAFFRFLYNAVGETWLWWEKRVASDEEIKAFISRPGVEFYLLSVGGAPAGFVQLTFPVRPSPPAFEKNAEISYFGLLPDYIGRKLGAYLLDWAVDTCWSHPSAPQKILLNTCTLDHPAALPNYQKSGFVTYDQKIIVIPDPRACGIIPPHIKLAQPQPTRQGDHSCP